MSDFEFLKTAVSDYKFAELPDVSRVSSEEEKNKSEIWPKSDWNVCSIVSEIESDKFVFLEFFFKKDSSQSDFVPVLYVFDKELNTVRAYSDMKFVCEERAEIVTDDEVSLKNNIVIDIISAMAENNIEKVMACFGDEASFSHSNGDKVAGSESVRSEFIQMMGDKGLTFLVKKMVETDSAIGVECEFPNGLKNAAVYTLDRFGYLANVRTYM